jgi:AAA family ATP:ADP antiporter
MLAGLMTVVKSPYLLGIFGLVLFYESLNVVLNFQRLLILKEATSSIAGLTAGMFEQRLWMHIWSFLLSLFGVRYVVHFVGVRLSLVLVPLLMGLSVAYFMIMYNPDATTAVFILVGAINYSFSSPLKEALYIPATKDVKFKSKSWIDSFGTKFSKSFGSLFNDFARRIAVPGSALFLTIYSVFFFILIMTWLVTALLLGKTYEDAVLHGKIIGADDEESASAE